MVASETLEGDIVVEKVLMSLHLVCLCRIIYLCLFWFGHHFPNQPLSEMLRKTPCYITYIQPWSIFGICFVTYTLRFNSNIISDNTFLHYLLDCNMSATSHKLWKSRGSKNRIQFSQPIGCTKHDPVK